MRAVRVRSNDQRVNLEFLDLTDDGTTLDVHASFPTFDIDGNPEGDADLTITVARTGEVRLIVPDPGKTNYKNETSGIEKLLEGSGTLAWDGSEIALPACSGVDGDVTFFYTSPRAFVSSNTRRADRVHLGGGNVEGGSLCHRRRVRFLRGCLPVDRRPRPGPRSGRSSGAVELGGMNLDFEARGPTDGRCLLRDCVRDVHAGRSPRDVNAREPDVPDKSHGTRARAVGHSSNSRQAIRSPSTPNTVTPPGLSPIARAPRPKGPKRGPLPTNDGPDGAIALHVGSRLNASNVAATPEPEFQLANCPEGFFDQFGNTLWYSIEGTGSPVTIDTAGSNFDTLIAVYEPMDPRL